MYFSNRTVGENFVSYYIVNKNPCGIKKVGGGGRILGLGLTAFLKEQRL